MIFFFNISKLLSFTSDSVKSVNNVDILRNDLNSIISNPDFSNAMIGISVQSVESGEYIFNKDEYKNFIPASTQKIITTISALDFLGSDYKFITKLYLDGVLFEGGEFIGNIIIKASGDPTFSKYFYKEPLEILDKWAKKLDSFGINSIKGNLIADDSYFDDITYGPGWMWDDFSYYFSPQISALSINDNRVDFFLYSGDSVGSISKVVQYPQTDYYRFVNSIITTNNNEPAEINGYRENATNLIKLRGKIPLKPSENINSLISVTIDKPALFFLNLFKQSIEKQNINFKGALLTSKELLHKLNYQNLKLFEEHHSSKLFEIINVINQESHNLAAEMLFKTLGKENFDSGSFSSGSEYLYNFCSKAGINKQSIRIADGSGLSRLNLISPINQVLLLNYIIRSSFKDIFLKSLAKPGEPGTLKRRMLKSKAEKSVLAKTGSMNNISNICGYVTSRDNETFAFSIMMQNFTTSQIMANNLQDLILMRLSSFQR